MSARRYIISLIALLSAGFASAQGSYGVAELSLSADPHRPSVDERASVDELVPFDARFDSIVRNPVEYRRILDKFTAGVERPSVSECTIAYYGFPYQEAYTGIVEGEEEMQAAIMGGRFLPAWLLGKQMLP